MKRHGEIGQTRKHIARQFAERAAGFIKLAQLDEEEWQAEASGRHVNIQMRYLKAAWEAHKRERGHSNGR